MNIDTSSLNTVMEIVLEIIQQASLYIGIIIVLWGVFQIILAFRREDSEGISKQVTTIVVGAILIAFGQVAVALYQNLRA